MITRLVIGTVTTLAALALSGCYAISDPDVWPKDFVQKDVVPDLVGKHEDEVLEKLGTPTLVVRNRGTTSFLYEKLEDDTVVGILFYIPIAFSTKEVEASCVLLNFDSKHILQDFEIESSGAARGAGYEAFYSCAKLFGIDASDSIDGAIYVKNRRQTQDP